VRAPVLAQPMNTDLNTSQVKLVNDTIKEEEEKGGGKSDSDSDNDGDSNGDE
jgi:hypothetical protein